MITKARSGNMVWVPAIFIRWIHDFDGMWYDIKKYYHKALENDGSRWT